MSKSSNWESTIKPIVVLSVISLIASLLLALVNGMTAPVIAENTMRTTLAAYVGVLPSVSDASELDEVTDYTTAGITGVVKAPDGSPAIKAEEKGFDGGILPVIMGFTSGIAIIIALGQVDNFFGTVSEGSSTLETLASYARLGFHPNLQTVLIGALVVAVMLVWSKKWGA